MSTAPAIGQPPGLPRSTFAMIVGASVVTTMGASGMISVMPAIAREIGIPDVLAASVFSFSSLIWAIASPYWARASDRRGRRPMILMGLSGFTVSTFVCAFVIAAGIYGVTGPMLTFGLFFVLRALNGLLGSATNPAAQAYVAEHTTPERRTRALANLAGGVGLGTVLGPFLAPLFVLPIVGLSGPLFGFAAIGAGMLTLLWLRLPESSRANRSASAAAVKGRSPIWRDRRVRPFLIYGFLISIIQSGQGQILGFLVIDKLGVSPMEAHGFIAVAMMFGAVAMLLAQWGLIPMFEMNPRQLLRWGAAVTCGGVLILAAAPDYWTAVVGFAVSSLGCGLARPGFTAGASLAVDQAEQGRAAGAVAAVNGINVVFAPLFVLAYKGFSAAPFLTAGAIAAGLLIYCLRNSQLRAADARPTGADAAAQAALERADEGGGP
jgi:MFS family permease